MSKKSKPSAHIKPIHKRVSSFSAAEPLQERANHASSKKIISHTRRKSQVSTSDSIPSVENLITDNSNLRKEISLLKQEIVGLKIKSSKNALLSMQREIQCKNEELLKVRKDF